MRDCVKNQQLIYQQRYLGQTEILDEDEYGTGSFAPTYGTQLALYKNVVSAVKRSSSQVDAEPYGLLQKHTKVIVTSEPFDVGIQDLFWVETDPTNEANYKVGGIYKGLTSTIIGLDTRITNV